MVAANIPDKWGEFELFCTMTENVNMFMQLHWPNQSDKRLILSYKTSSSSGIYLRLLQRYRCCLHVQIKPGDPYNGARFSNGKIWAEYAAEELDVPLESFAIGGATTGAYPWWASPQSYQIFEIFTFVLLLSRLMILLLHVSKESPMKSWDAGQSPYLAVLLT